MKKLNIGTLPNSLSSIIGLCYIDPVSEKLVEFNSDEKIYLTPFENTVRRYYLVVVDTLHRGIRLQYATIKVSSEYDDIYVKILEGNTNNDRYNYDDVEANNSVTVFFNNYPNGIIPLDINIKSLTATNVQFSIDIGITAG